jgi:hypothetical protein
MLPVLQVKGTEVPGSIVLGVGLLIAGSIAVPEAV